MAGAPPLTKPSRCSTVLHAMPKEVPPTTASEALVWAKEAMIAGRYLVDPHVRKRMVERAVEWRSIWYALKNAAVCLPYAPDGGGRLGGTSWRVIGPDHDGEDVTVGVETFVDHLGRRVLLLTVF
jgi:hypothetical protein